ncbi:MAG TPA: ECF-type sigma factor [Planctomycetaceae bacterium]
MSTDQPRTLREDDPEFLRFAERLRSLEEEAAEELLARFSVRLLSLARKGIGARLVPKGDEEDVVQSVFRTFFRRLGEEEVELRDWASLSGLLSLLTLKKCQQFGRHYQAARRDVRLEVSLYGDGGATVVVAVPDREPTPDEAAALNEIIERSFRELDDRDREAVEAVMAGRNVDQVAAGTGRSKRAVQRAMARFRQTAIAACR